MDFNTVLLNSSAVEELEERKEFIWLKFGPNCGGQHVPKDDLKVILDRKILSAGECPRFRNHGSNILIFGDEAYRIKFLKKMGFGYEWITKNLLPEQPLAEIIELFPEQIEPLSDALTSSAARS